MRRAARFIAALFALGFPLWGVDGPDPLGVYTESLKPAKRIEWDYTLDAYYTSGDMILNFTDKPIPDAGEMKEADVYRNLLYSSLVPRQVILEASVNPLPVAGVLIRENANDFYQRTQLGGESFNLVRAVTNGFQEPYAISMFLGNIVRYHPPTKTAEDKERNKQSGYQSSLGYVGYVVSYGSHHIKDNQLFADNWVELEWKIKGDQLFTLQKLQWSYKFGVKLHDNPDISDVIFIGVKRDRLDYTSDLWDFMVNSGFELRVDFKTTNLKPARVYFELNKKWPFKETLAATLAIGFLWQSASLYSGPLDNFPGGENFQILLRPNIQF